MEEEDSTSAEKQRRYVIVNDPCLHSQKVTCSKVRSPTSWFTFSISRQLLISALPPSYILYQKIDAVCEQKSFWQACVLSVMCLKVLCIMAVSFTQRKTMIKYPQVWECLLWQRMSKCLAAASAVMMKQAASTRQIPKTHVLLKWTILLSEGYLVNLSQHYMYAIDIKITPLTQRRKNNNNIL